MNETKYHLEQTSRAKFKIEKMLSEMPECCRDFFIAIEGGREANTLLSYAYKLKFYLQYLIDNDERFCYKDIKAISLNDFKLIKTRDIEMFAHYLRNKPTEVKTPEGKKVQIVANCDNTIDRYYAVLSSFYKYLLRAHVISDNPMDGLNRRVKDKGRVIKMNKEETEKLLNVIKYGDGLTNRQKAAHQKLSKRDLAICFLFLDTGLRISELVGLDMKHISFTNHSCEIIGKGGLNATVYMSDMAEDYLRDYLSMRDTFHPSKDEDALFLSSSGKRISVRMIQEMVKKYVEIALPERAEEITPHKFRSTYCTSVLNQTGNLRLTQELARHKNIATTTVYTAIEKEDLQAVRNLH